MIRRPPISTRTDTLFPYTTLFRSLDGGWTSGARARRVRMVPQDAAARRLVADPVPQRRSEEHTSELQSLMRISYAVFCLKKKKNKKNQTMTQAKWRNNNTVDGQKQTNYRYTNSKYVSTIHNK